MWRAWKVDIWSSLRQTRCSIIHLRVHHISSQITTYITFKLLILVLLSMRCSKIHRMRTYLRLIHHCITMHQNLAVIVNCNYFINNNGHRNSKLKNHFCGFQTHFGAWHLPFHMTKSLQCMVGWLRANKFCIYTYLCMSLLGQTNKKSKQTKLISFFLSTI